MQIDGGLLANSLPVGASCLCLDFHFNFKDESQQKDPPYKSREGHPAYWMSFSGWGRIGSATMGANDRSAGEC